MPGTQVWKKEDLPERFHYKNNIRTSPIVLLANPGIFIQGVSDLGNFGNWKLKIVYIIIQVLLY